MSSWNMGLLGASSSLPVGLELLQTTTLTGTESSIIFSNLNSTYASEFKHLQIRGMIRTNEGTTVGNLQLRFNSDSASNYRNFFLNSNGSSWSAFNFADASLFIGQTCGSTAPAGANNAFILDILDAFNSNKRKATRSFYGVSGMTNQQMGFINGVWNQNTAISSIEVLSVSHTLAAGARVSLYGMRGA